MDNSNGNNDGNSERLSRIPSRIPLPSRKGSPLRVASPSRIPLPSSKRIQESSLSISTAESTYIQPSEQSSSVEQVNRVKNTVQSIERSIAIKESRLPITPSLIKKRVQLSPIEKKEVTNLNSGIKLNVRFSDDIDPYNNDDKINNEYEEEEEHEGSEEQEGEEEECKVNRSKDTDINYWNSDEEEQNLENDNDVDNRKSSKKAEDGFFLRLYKELAGMDPDEEDEDETFFHFVEKNVNHYVRRTLSLFLGESPIFVEEIYTYKNLAGDKRTYKLNIFQRIFVMLENPSSCQLGQIISVAMFAIIILSCIDYVIATLPQLNVQPDTCDNPACSFDINCPNTIVCEPQPPEWLGTVELACIVIFSIEYGIRVLLIGLVPPRLADLIPSTLLKFKLENEMINDEQSLFSFTKRSMLGTKAAVGRMPKQASIQFNKLLIDSDKVEESEKTAEEDVADVSNISFYLFSGGVYEKANAEMNEDDSFCSKVFKPLKQILFPEVKLLDPLNNKLTSTRINERLDMPWYMRILKYQFSLLNIIDVCAILPYYIQLATSSSSSISFIRLLRLARIFRVFKVGRSSAGLRVITKAMKKAASALGIVTFFIPLGIVFFGSVIFLFEGGNYTVSHDFPDGAWVRQGRFGASEESPYISIPTSMYWAVVTSTTTGYGDIVPTTLYGSILSIVCMYYGVLLMALPITVIGNNFTREYEKHHGNNAERMVFECLLDIAKVTNDETVMRAQGLIPIDSTEFKLMRLALIITTFDNTKRDALKRSLIANIRKRKKLENTSANSTISYSSETILPEIYDSQDNKDRLKEVLRKLTESMSTSTLNSNGYHRKNENFRKLF